MAVERSFMLKLFADPKEVLNAFGKIRQSLDETFSGAGKEGLDKLGANLNKVGLIGSAASAAVGGALFLMAKEADNANRETLKLNNAIKNQGDFAEGAELRMVQLAKSIQQTTSADADAIIGAQALLVQFGLTETQIKQLTPLVVDLSEATGVGLSDAALSVAKSVDGSAKALKGYGINVDENAIKTDAFAATVSALSGTVGGFAEKQGATFSGSLERMRNNLGDLRESVGAGAATVFTPLADAAGKAANVLANLDKVSNGTVGAIAAVGTIGLGASSQVALLAGNAIKLRDSFSKVTEVNGETIRTISGLGKAVMGTAGVIAGAIVVYSLYSNKKQEAKQRTEDFSDALRLEGDAQTKSLQALAQRDDLVRRNLTTMQNLGFSIQDVNKFVEGQEVPALERVIELREELVRFLSGGLKTTELALGPQGQMVELTKGEAGEILNLINMISSLVKAREDEAGAALLVAGATEEVIKLKITERSLDQIVAEARLRATLGKYDEMRAIGATADALDKFQRSQGIATEATRSGSRATKEAKDEMKKMKEISELYAKAQENLSSAQKTFESATKSVTSAQKSLASAQNQLAGADATLTAAKEKLAAAMRGQGRDSAAAQRAARSVAQAQRDLERANMGVTDAINQQQRAQERLDALKAKAADPRKIVDAEFNLEGAKIAVEEATLRVQEAEADLAKTMADPDASPLEKRKAELDLVNAKRALSRAVLEVGDSEAELIATRATGATAEEIAEAERDLQEAKLSVQDAIERQTLATEELNERNDEYRKIAEGIREGDKEYVELTAEIVAAQEARTKAAEDLADALSAAKEAADELSKALFDLETAKAATKRGVVGEAPEFRAAGGPVTAGKPYIVGEMGPELFVPGASGNIVPNGKMGTVVNVVVNAGVGTSGTQVGQEIVDVLRQYTKVSGPLSQYVAV